MSPVFDEEKYRALCTNLEVNEIKLSELISGFRIDSSFYTGKFNRYLKMVQKGTYSFIGNECEKACKGIFDIKASSYCLSGVPFIRIADLKNMQIDPSDIVYITDECNHENSNSALMYGDIILSKTAIPAASIVNIPKCNVSQDTIAIKLKKNSSVDPFYMVVYLNSKFGLSLMENLFTGNIQKHFNLTDCKEKLPIPVFTEQFQNKIRFLLERGIELTKNAMVLYKHSEQAILTELEMFDFQPNDQSVSIKTFVHTQFAGRLDAEYYQQKYEDILSKVKSYTNGTTTVGAQFRQNKAQMTLTRPEYNYIEISDINVSSGEATFNLLHKNELPANAKYVVERGDILISKVRPNRGAISIIDFEPENLIASGAFTILQETGNIRKEILAILLRTPLYRDWMLKWNVGSSYPVIKDEDILNLIIPQIPGDIQNKIVVKIQESFAFRKESKRLLDLAKHAVELAIEQGEDSAMKLLKDHENAR